MNRYLAHSILMKNMNITSGKEFDEEGEDIGNGVPGIQAYYFGARMYEPEIGVWFSVDNAGQYWSPYAYSGNGTNPITYIDPDGYWGVLFHLFTGGWNNAKVDTYRRYKPTHAKYKGHSFAHTGEIWEKDDPEYWKIIERQNLIDLLNGTTEKPDCFSKKEWEGIKQHALQDYFHDVEPLPLSPIQNAIYGAKGAAALNKYVDHQEAFWAPSLVYYGFARFLLPPGGPTQLTLDVLTSFELPLAGVAFLDWMISIFNWRSWGEAYALSQLGFKINRPYYIKWNNRDNKADGVYPEHDDEEYNLQGVK
ncbi:MAG: hypothetical protein GF398_11505 [Chitinivibrionales bacterium]|nr:hypothetical protein [Chitinivibrionales bacterium]